MLDTNRIRADFPILSRQVNGHPLIYLDNAATSQKPQPVIKSITDYYTNHNANVHRGIHTLGDESTRGYQKARETVARFIGSNNPNELIFTKNTTEGVNLVSYSWAAKHLKSGDQVVVSGLEHHSNLLPWQRACTQTKAKLIELPVTVNGQLNLELLDQATNPKTSLVAITHVSNVTGEILDIVAIVSQIKKNSPKAKIFLDGAQSVPHMPVNVRQLGIDFLAFSAHKMCGPQGIGALWVKQSVLNTMDPYLLGGGMISSVKLESYTPADLPDRFDAGTPNVSGAIGFAAACDYLNHIGMPAIHRHEQDLTRYALEKFTHLEEQGIVTLYGPRSYKNRAGIITFNVQKIHAHDVAQILDRKHAIAIRSGHHCNQPLMEKLKVPATCRASFYLYNTKEEIDELVKGLETVRKVFTK